MFDCFFPEPNAVTFYPSLDRLILLSHVDPYSNYTIAVCGYTHAGDGIYSTPVVIETLQARKQHIIRQCSSVNYKKYIQI